MTNAKTETSTIYRCECGYHHSSLERANKCGTCEDCGVVYPTDKTRSHSWTVCRDCSNKRDEKREVETLDKAKEITWAEYEAHQAFDGEPDEPVVYDPDQSGCNEGFMTLEELEEHYSEEALSLPKYVYGVRVIRFSLDADSIIESALENEHHEDAGSTISSEEIEELQTFLDSWAKDRNIKSFTADTSIKINIKEALTK